MAHNFISEEERNNLSAHREKMAALDIAIAKSNAQFVGEPREHKGVQYQMKQNSTYECLNVSPTSKLAGAFTSAQAIRKTIDDLEKMGELKL